MWNKYMEGPSINHAAAHCIYHHRANVNVWAWQTASADEQHSGWHGVALKGPFRCTSSSLDSAKGTGWHGFALERRGLQVPPKALILPRAHSLEHVRIRHTTGKAPPMSYLAVAPWHGSSNGMASAHTAKRKHVASCDLCVNHVHCQQVYGCGLYRLLLVNVLYSNKSTASGNNWSSQAHHYSITGGHGSPRSVALITRAYDA